MIENNNMKKSKVVAVRITPEQEKQIQESGIDPSDYIRNAIDVYKQNKDIKVLIEKAGNSLSKADALLDQAEKALKDTLELEEVFIDITTSQDSAIERYSWEMRIFINTSHPRSTKKELRQIFPDSEIAPAMRYDLVVEVRGELE